MSTAKNPGCLGQRGDDVVDDLGFGARLAILVRDIDAVAAGQPDTKHDRFHAPHTRRAWPDVRSILPTREGGGPRLRTPAVSPSIDRAGACAESGMSAFCTYAPSVDHWSRRTMALAGGVIAAALLVGAGAAWYWWPREVAPGLTPEMVKGIDHPGLKVTVIGGGSRRDAHALWARYHDRAPMGEPPMSPRLLGISLANVETDSVPGTGTYWVVYCDGVWNQSFGPDASASGFGREVTYLDPDSLRALSSSLF
jgi:hypothetical protein